MTLKTDLIEALSIYKSEGKLVDFGDVEEQADGSVTYSIVGLPPLIAFRGDVSGEAISLLRPADPAGLID